MTRKRRPTADVLGKCRIGGDRRRRLRTALVWTAGSLLLLSAPARAAENPPTAAELYQNSCARCHGADGHNPRLQVVFPDLPDFTNAKWQAAHTAAEFKKVILHGGKDGMPAYQGDLQTITAGELVQYLRGFARPKPKH